MAMRRLARLVGLGAGLASLAGGLLGGAGGAHATQGWDEATWTRQAGEAAQACVAAGQGGEALCVRLNSPAWVAGCQAMPHLANDTADECLTAVAVYAPAGQPQTRPPSPTPTNAPTGAPTSAPGSGPSPTPTSTETVGPDQLRQMCLEEAGKRGDPTLAQYCEALLAWWNQTSHMLEAVDTSAWNALTNGGDPNNPIWTPYAFAYAVGLVLMIGSLVIGFAGANKQKAQVKITTLEVLQSMGIRAATFVPICLMLPGAVAAVMILLIEPAGDQLAAMYVAGAERLLGMTSSNPLERVGQAIATLVTDPLLLLVLALVGIVTMLAVAVELAVSNLVVPLMMCLMPPALGLAMNPNTRAGARNIMIGLFTAMLIRPSVYFALWIGTTVTFQVEQADTGVIAHMVANIALFGFAASAPALSGMMVAPLIGQTVGALSGHQQLANQVGGVPGRVGGQAVSAGVRMGIGKIASGMGKQVATTARDTTANAAITATNAIPYVGPAVAAGLHAVYDATTSATDGAAGAAERASTSQTGSDTGADTGAGQGGPGGGGGGAPQPKAPPGPQGTSGQSQNSSKPRPEGT